MTTQIGRGLKSALVCLAAFGALAALPGCGNLSSNVVFYPPDLDRSPTSRETLQTTVDKIVQPFIDKGTNIGTVVGVIDGGQTTTIGYGRLSLQSDISPDGDTVFAIGSVTKAFLSLIAYQMAREGSLGLSETLETLFPHERAMTAAAKQITVGQLLTHSSGLPRQPQEPEMFVSLVNYVLTGENIYRHVDAEKVFEALRNFYPDRDDVGTFRYSNIGSAILGRILELKAGQPIEAVMSERILEPIGAKDTSYRLTAEQRPRLATGHVGDSPFFLRRNTPMAQWDMGDILSNSAGLYSTANDLLALLRYRLSLEPAAPDIIPIRVGLLSVSNKAEQKTSYGWKIDEFDDGDPPIVFQFGIISGYSAYIGVVPERDVGVVVLTNSFNWDDYIGHSLLLLLANRKAAQSARSP